MTTAQQNLPRWDLSALFSGLDDPKLNEALVQLQSKAEAFEQRYKGTLSSADVSADHLKNAMDNFEAMSVLGFKPMAYAQLMFVTNTQDPQRGALLQKVREITSRINTHLVFFEIEIGRIPTNVFAKLIEDSVLDAYRYYLQKIQAQAHHHLSEPEEKILSELSSVRGPAFVRLHIEIENRSTYLFERENTIEELQLSDVTSLLRNPDRTVREQASLSLTDGVKKNAHSSTFIFNTLMHEKDVLGRLRGFELPETERHVNNDIEQEAVDAMVDTCALNFDMVAEYYAFKKDLLGIKELTHYDRYAPLASAEKEISWDDARNIVMDAFEAFSPDIAQQVEAFFTQNWIDAEVVPGKSGGAFCSGVTPDLHPVVFMNFTNNLDDVMTLAHELGHGLHDLLAAHNHMLDYHPALPLAETASTFAEMLTFDTLISRLDNPKDQLALLCDKIENIFATVFRQIGIFRFEREIHNLRRTKGELPTEAINEAWQRTQQEMFGDSLKLGKDHEWWWIYIAHVFQVPFYVYAYAFGELLALSLYARYQEQGDSFISGYVELLAAGGAASPATLTNALGVDIADPAFWQSGCDLIRQRIEQAKALAASA
jgi:oligoendopeptidase F